MTTHPLYSGVTRLTDNTSLVLKASLRYHPADYDVRGHLVAGAKRPCILFGHPSPELWSEIFTMIETIGSCEAAICSDYTQSTQRIDDSRDKKKLIGLLCEQL